MILFETASALVALAAGIGHINAKWTKLPEPIAMTAGGTTISLAIVGAGLIEPRIGAWAQEQLSQIDFHGIVFNGILGMLLFAGALHIQLRELAKQKWTIAILASAGIVASSAIAGAGFWAIASLFNVHVSPLFALLFGVLISPTDPIAVLGILKKAGVPQSLEMKIIGESLFNDGFAVVLFLVVLTAAQGDASIEASPIGLMLAQEILGGALIGLALGYVASHLLANSPTRSVATLTTLAVATGGFALATALHVAAPIAVVVAGLMIGNHSKTERVSEETQAHIEDFWDMTDEILNMLLFILIGLELLVLTEMSINLVPAAALCIPLVLAARYLSVGAALLVRRPYRGFTPHAVKMMTWGGLRGGVSIALVLALPEFPGHDLMIAATFAVVLFSILVQATTVGPLAQKLASSKPANQKG